MFESIGGLNACQDLLSFSEQCQPFLSGSFFYGKRGFFQMLDIESLGKMIQYILAPGIERWAAFGTCLVQQACEKRPLLQQSVGSLNIVVAVGRCNRAEKCLLNHKVITIIMIGIEIKKVFE